MKTLISFLAIIVMASASAQPAAQTQQKMLELQRTLGPGESATVGRTNNGPAFVPKKPAALAAKQGGVASAINGAPTKVGDKVKLPNGKELVLAEDGNLHEVGEILADQNGRFIVMNDGKIFAIPAVQQPAPPAPAPASAPSPGPANNGPAVAQVDHVVPPQFGPNGEVLVYDPSTKTWDIPAGVKQAMAAQSSVSSGGAGKSSNEDRPETIAMRRNEVLVNRRSDGQTELLLEERARERTKVVRLYDLEENAPTSGSARAVEARNGVVSGGGAFVGGGIVVGGGMYAGVTPVYSQPISMGPVNWSAWNANQFWSRPCATCR